MKIQLFTLLFLLIAFQAQAQYIPGTAQSFQFASAFNPAFSGIDNFGDLKLSYRYQWTGFGSNAPRFINLAYNSRLKQPLDLSINSSRSSNVSALNPELLPKGKRIIHGFGVNFFNEQYGVINRIGGGLNYAFHYPLFKKTRLSFGASAMVDNTKVDVSKVGVREPDNDPFYQSLLASGSSQTNLNVRGGVLIYSPTFYFGASYFPILNSAIQDDGVSTSDIFYQGSLQGGIRIPVGENSSIRPSVMALWQLDNTFAIDYSVKVFLQEKVWFGLTYRDTQSGILLFGIDINDKMGFAYSYELSMGGRSQFTNGSHDLVLAFRFNNFRRQNQYAW
ncbi:MAG TPA: PorP/SprF family type IX secretion system membrane protein [Chryseolinea sp.]|nr:PorP/SprF family type IX secretion system membrane protein [Chryseolinea sp.]